jgi:hypothetical protein
VIADAIDAWYAEQKEEREFRISPSSLGDCLRKLAWLQVGMEPFPLSPETRRTFELGHQRGEALEAASKQIWPDARSQVPVRLPAGKFTLTGTADLWIPSLRTLVDFKTVGSYGAGLLSSEGVSEDYKLQVHAYRDGIAEANVYSLAGDYDEHTKPTKRPETIRSFIVYEAKDSDARKGVKGGQLIELEVPWTEELEERYQTRLREVEGILIRHAQGTLDPTSYPELPLVKGQKSWKCKHPYCSVGQERGGCYK